MKLLALTAGIDYEGETVVGLYASEDDARAAAETLWGRIDWARVNRYPVPCLEGRPLDGGENRNVPPDSCAVYELEVGAPPRWL